MLWLASYPRSGNTFLRVILSQVYGIESSELFDPHVQADRAYLDYPVVKTHLLPGELVPDDPAVPAVYIVRDGRDAVVSAARYHCDFVAPGAAFAPTLRAAIRARGGSFFGGWSRHVRLWRRRAVLVLRFEDLIADPLATAERIRAIYPLPAPRGDQLPSFGELRARRIDFGPHSEAMDSAHFREHFYRRGQVGAWKDEMPLADRLLFYALHGWTLWRAGYLRACGGAPVRRTNTPPLALRGRVATPGRGGEEVSAVSESLSEPRDRAHTVPNPPRTEHSSNIRAPREAREHLS